MIRGSIRSDASFLYVFFVGSLCFLVCVYVPYLFVLILLRTERQKIGYILLFFTHISVCKVTTNY